MRRLKNSLKNNFLSSGVQKNRCVARPIDYAALPEHEKHIFISNLKYQTLLDSIQGRSPNVALLPLVSIPELETWIETWTFSETIHSRSYTHIIRNIVNDPSIVFDDIVTNEEIINVHVIFLLTTTI